MANIREALEFGAVLAQEFPKIPSHQIASNAFLLIHLAHRHQTLSVNACNRPLTRTEEKTLNRIENFGMPRIASRLLGAENGEITPEGNAMLPGYGHDPRGATVKLVLPSGRTNDIGREGWCVPV